MTKVNVDSLKPWIAQRITELLGIDDDVIVEFVYNQLEERVIHWHGLNLYFYDYFLHLRLVDGIFLLCVCSYVTQKITQIHAC